MKHISVILLCISVGMHFNISAQDINTSQKKDSIAKTTTKFSGLQLGGYGEAVYSYNFYSGDTYRYQYPEKHKDFTHGRVDLPHIVFFVGYEFGNGWRMNSEIEFEHGGIEAAVEYEADEGGEYETEIERGGEVVMEQFWIEKTFSRTLNIRMGQIIVPIGLTNGNHLPTQFFTSFRPEGESTIIPCTWHETGISIWGHVGDWRYEAMVLPALDADLFRNDRWVGSASASPYEFRIANNLAGAARIDNYSIAGLRLGISGYYGQSFKNSLVPSQHERYAKVKGAVSIGSFDFEYNNHNLIARGYFNYGKLGDAALVNAYNRSLGKLSPSSRTSIGSNALATAVEVGYDIFSFIKAGSFKNKQLYLFGRYDYYDSMYKVPDSVIDEKQWERHCYVGGINFFPIKEIVVKAEYSYRKLAEQFNDESAIIFSIAYSGFFK